MSNELFVKIVVLLFSLMWALITAYVLPWIRTKRCGNELEQLFWFITYSVRSAEQIYTSNEFKEKKGYVMSKAITFMKGLGIELTLDDLDAIVEGVVNEVKHG